MTFGLVLGFRSSSALAGAYGVALTTTMAITTALAFPVAWKLWVPQAVVGAGVAIFAVCLIDDLLTHLAGGTPSYRRAAEASALDRAGEEL